MVRRERKLSSSRCQCCGCGHYFNSTGAFDKHRIEDKIQKIRRCRTPEEMEKAGMLVTVAGWWVTSAWDMASASCGDGDLARSEGVVLPT